MKTRNDKVIRFLKNLYNRNKIKTKKKSKLEQILNQKKWDEQDKIKNIKLKKKKKENEIILRKNDFLRMKIIGQFNKGIIIKFYYKKKAS